VVINSLIVLLKNITLIFITKDLDMGKKGVKQVLDDMIEAKEKTLVSKDSGSHLAHLRFKAIYAFKNYYVHFKAS
jgi:hypothetical protein